MSITPMTLFSRIESLKRWQEEQQHRLVKLQSQQSLQDSAEDRVSLNGDNSEEHMIYENTPHRVDDIPIKSPRKNFQELLNEKLKEIEPTPVAVQNAKPKKAFLRKGSGLCRYRMSMTDTKVKTPKVTATSKSKSKVEVAKSILKKGTWISEVDVSNSKNKDDSDKHIINESQELKIFELLEEKAVNSSFCSTSSYVTRLLSVKSPQKVTFKDSLTDIIEQKSSNSNNVASEDQTNSSDDSDEFWDSSSYTSSTDTETETPFPENTIIQKDVATNTEESSFDQVTSELLRQRLQQLEKEIEAFRSERSRTAAALHDLETSKAEMEKVKKSFEAAQVAMNQELAEERKKLSDEKKRLSTRDISEKRLNSELKSQVSILKQEISEKDAKHGATQAKSRSRIRVLEKEIAKLRTENEELRQQVARMQRQVVPRRNSQPSDTKMLHEINRTLSKLVEREAAAGKENIAAAPQGGEDDSFDLCTSSKSCKLKELSPKIQKSAVTSIDNLKVMDSPRTLESYKINEARPTCTLLDNGAEKIEYPNGTIKIVSADRKMITVTFSNGDIKHTDLNSGIISYTHSSTGTRRIMEADGTEILHFPDGQIERKSPNGHLEVHYPDGSVRSMSPGGTCEKVSFPDGTNVETNTLTGERKLSLPNGQTEIHTKDHMRREYPDGTVKLLYPDGVQETRYSNGRVRLKDQHGNLILDTNSNIAADL